MKVGIICEGRLGGEDAQIFEHFASRIAPHAAVKTLPQGTKPELIRDQLAANSSDQTIQSMILAMTLGTIQGDTNML